MRRLVLALGLLIGLASPAFAQNPCTDPLPSGTMFKPTKVLLTLPDQNATEPDGSATVTDYQIAYFAPGADVSTATPIVGPITVPKAAFAAIAVTAPDCYQLTTLPTYPPGIALVAAVKAHRASSGPDVGELASDWSVVSNPFGSARTVLQRPGQARVGR